MLADTQARNSSRMRLPMVLAFVAIAALLGAYWTYVRSRAAYFAARDLRVLSTFAGQVDNSFDALNGFVRNFAWYSSEPTPTIVRRSDSNIPDLKIADVLPNFQSGQTPCEVPEILSRAGGQASPSQQEKYLDESAPSSESTVRTIALAGGARWLRIAYAGVRVNPTMQQQANPFLLNYASPSNAIGQRELRTACGDIDLSSVINPLILQSFLKAFDGLMIVDAKNGEVIYAARPNRGIEIAPADIGVTNVSVMRERVGWRDYAELDASALSQQTREIDVDVAGDSYKLFTRPFIFAARDVSGRIGPPEETTRWIVCGLVAQSRFQSEVRTISASRVAIIVAVLILAICWWPFLRIWLSDEHKALTITDAISVVFSAMIVTSLVTLIFIDAVGYSRLSQTGDDQLREFAASMQEDFSSDILRAARALHAIKPWSERRNWSDWQLAGFGESGRVELLTDPDIAAFPYFSQIAWIDPAGNQIYKASRVRRTPRVSVAERTYFQNALNGRTWHIQEQGRAKTGAQAGYEVTLESVRSLTNGQAQAVMAMPTGNKELPVLAMAFDLIDVMHAVPPAGVRFAIVNEDGDVIFHSEQERIGVERFFSETDDARDLRSAILARRERKVSTPYWGEDHSLYVRPLKGTAWSLVTFRQKGLFRAVNIEMLVITILLLLLSTSIYLVIFLIIVLRMPRYRAPSLWPDKKRAEDYTHLIVAYALAAVAISLCIYGLAPRSLLRVLFVAPAQTVLSTYLLLHHRRRSWVYVFAFTGWMVTSAFYAWFIVAGDIGAHLAVSNAPTAMKMLLLFVLLLESATALGYFIGRESATLQAMLARVRYPLSYRVSGVLLLIATSALPTIGFFKIASWLELETLVKFAQRDLIGKLETRLEKITEASFATAADFTNSTSKEAPSALRRLRADALPARFGHMFQTAYCVTFWKDRSCNGCAKGSQPIVPDAMANVFPQYSDESVGMRELYGAEATDGGWRACRSGRVLTMDQRAAIPRPALTLFLPDGTAPPEQRFVVTSEVPLLFPTLITPIN
ncbi:MAG TPA: cache domain-containing protein, partial [Thermoanaerobaculia bacterium]|nr:cache domain-containing protein [Thermoanaerobaculia bacterium]